MAFAGLLLLPGCPKRPELVVHPRYVPALNLHSVGPTRTTVDALHGRVLLVNFMATWCIPCLEEIPALIALQKKYENQGFTVVLVGMDLEGALVLDPFAEHYQAPFPVLVADDYIRSGQSPFGPIQVLPLSFLIGPDGELRAAVQGIAPPDDMAALIERELRLLHP
jgi:thiol-disulfide isomerase/thioredoxin